MALAAVGISFVYSTIGRSFLHEAVALSISIDHMSHLGPGDIKFVDSPNLCWCTCSGCGGQDHPDPGTIIGDHVPKDKFPFDKFPTFEPSK